MPAPSRALVSPQADFWLLGGLSLLIPLSLGWLFPRWNLHMAMQQYGAGFLVATLFNAPHFAFSYQIFYDGLLRRLRSPEVTFLSKARMVTAGFIVPAAMLVYFAAAMATNSMGMLSVSVNLMLLLSSWHYARQGYGALITASVYRNIFYGPRQKFILNANAYLIPLLTWLMFNARWRKSLFYDVPYAHLNLPYGLIPCLAVPVALFGALSLAVFMRIWLIEKRGLPFNGVIGYVCATYLWLGLMVVSPNFYFLVPIFHAVQYFPFIYKFKRAEIASREGIQPDNVWKNAKAVRSLIVFALTGFALGMVFMNFLPRQMDQLMLHYGPAPPGFSRNFFLVSFLLFINYHHFFIDYAFWRRDNRDVQQFLFKA